ncbi:MAG: hypothetical protein ABIY47_06430 [Opitutaceae bacterium]
MNIHQLPHHAPIQKNQIEPRPETRRARLFHKEVSGQLSDYCVALARMTGDDATTFRVFGSGTRVVRNGVYGVLTAYHCVHGPGRDLHLGELGHGRIFFISKSGKMPSAAQHEVREHVLGMPSRESTGADLTFTDIPLGRTLSELKTWMSCWRNSASTGCISRMWATPSFGMNMWSKRKKIARQRDAACRRRLAALG